MLEAGLRDLEEIVALAPADLQCLKTVRAPVWNNEITGIGFGTSPANFKNLVFGKRFYASFIHWDMHFGALIWDRQHGTLYLFDPGCGDRDGRIQQVIFVWSQFLNQIGYFGSFDFLLVPSMAQRDGWECGYLSLYWLLLTL